jgi:predicted helicase
MGNPPYSVGQRSANDNAQNQKYERLDSRIADTYAALTNATNKNSLYDSYIRAFRWSSDRLDSNGGIICFVSNGAWIDGNSADGFRKSLEKEFSSIYVFNLRGNQRTSGELSRKEGGKIFGSGSRTPISITLLVKKPSLGTQKASIYYNDIGEYLSREEKLAIVKQFQSVNNSQVPWKKLQPNEHGDWISMRNDVFDTYFSLGSKETKGSESVFNSVYSRGLVTARDAWCYNYSFESVEKNMHRTIDYYNQQRAAFFEAKKRNYDLKVENFVNYDSTFISWNRGIKQDLERNKSIEYSDKNIFVSSYRPFNKMKLYFAREMNDMVYLLPKLFPKNNLTNKLICVAGAGGSKDFSLLITDSIPNLDSIEKAQCFPLYFYEESQKHNISLFDEGLEGDYVRRDGVSDFILDRARRMYGKSVTKEDIFYYVYGFLHSSEYRTKFTNDLKKMLPRLPLVEEPRDFWKFSKAGRELAELHINYENVPPYEGVSVSGVERGNFKVEKMRFPKKDQKDTIFYNENITITGIPKEAYEYVVNGKSAVEWIMERYQVVVDRESGIKNDPNDWATEVGKPRYILDLLLSVINVSVKTVEIVKSLPKLSF